MRLELDRLRRRIGADGLPLGRYLHRVDQLGVGAELVLAENSSGRLLEVFDANSSLAATFAYSGTGCSSWSGSQTPDLCTATDPGSITSTYTYDSSNATAAFDYDMLGVTPPGATAATENQYNRSGQIDQQTDPSGQVLTFAYAGTDCSYDGGTAAVADYPDGAGTGKPQQVTVDEFSSNVLVAQTTGSGQTSAATTVSNATRCR